MPVILLYLGLALVVLIGVIIAVPSEGHAPYIAPPAQQGTTAQPVLPAPRALD